MQIAIVLFPRLTVLDAIGPYQTMDQLPGCEVLFVAEQAGPVRDETGQLGLVADAALADVPHPDLVLVPGGPGVDARTDGGPVADWLRAVDPTTTWTTSVCTGSLVLAAAGLLTGRRATTHWLAMEQLARYGAVPVSQRVTFDEKYVTAAGVSAGIDMGLTLAGRIAGDEVARSIQLMLEYDPRPPYQAGSPERAPEIAARFRAESRYPQPASVPE
ncbi:MAG TPA: DJ-1/PfpI family protein [Streptosporangiaceae bacterium]|nr:DJ-1/PfpI family protein [Streptosporangiaceae bacterium]